MKRKRDKMQADDAEPPEARAARARAKEEHARKLHRAQDEIYADAYAPWPPYRYRMHVVSLHVPYRP